MKREEGIHPSEPLWSASSYSNLQSHLAVKSFPENFPQIWKVGREELSMVDMFREVKGRDRLDRSLLSSSDLLIKLSLIFEIQAVNSL